MIKVSLSNIELWKRAHVFAHLLAHPAGVAVRGEAVEHHPEPFPRAETQGQHLAAEHLDRREVADEGEAGPQRHRAPGQVLGALLGELGRRRWLPVERHARAALAFDLALYPQEDFGIHRLRTGEAAPHPSGHRRRQEQQIGADDEQRGQVDEVLRPQHQAEDVELARAQVEQQRLAAVPLQPRRAVEGQLRQPDEQPAQPSVAAGGLARVDFLPRGVHVDDLWFRRVHDIEGLVYLSAAGAAATAGTASGALTSFDRLQT
jgi:hypothetical protein